MSALSAGRLRVIHGHIAQPQADLHPKFNYPENKFRYTVGDSVLSPAQRQFYEENGFIVLSGLIEPELLDECCKRFVDICEERVDPGNMTLLKDITLAASGAKGEFFYNKLQDILFDDVFEEYILHSNILDAVSNFTGPNIKVAHSMLINKPPDSGAMSSRHPLHQDLYYFPFRPAESIVAAWTAMEKCTKDNGCLLAIPGTHKGELLQHDYPQWEGGVNKASHGVSGYEDSELVYLEMEKGDTAFFHPLLIHGSGANTTKLQAPKELDYLNAFNQLHCTQDELVKSLKALC